MEYLKPCQLEVFKECIDKKSGGLSLPMGFGKTLVSILVALEQVGNRNGEILIVVAKNLIANWETEIKKFFKDSLSYKVFIGTDKKKQVDFSKYKIIITTPETIVHFYKLNDVDDHFVKVDQRLNIIRIPVNYNLYIEPDIPFIRMDNPMGGDLFYTKKWGSIVIDEGHNYFNITTLRCKALCSISAEHRWVLSGTLFDEPSPERILGYFLMINFNKYPRNLPDMKDIVKSRDKFQGVFETLVYRKENLMIIKETEPIVHKNIVSHKLSEKEAVIYGILKTVLIKMRKELRKYKLNRNTDQTKKFSSYILAMITYTRTFLVCPLITLSSIYLDVLDHNSKSELTKCLSEEFKRNNLYDWLNEESSILSTRMKEILLSLEKHPNERIVVFSSFRTTLNVLQNFIKGREILNILPTYSHDKRGKILEDFEKTKNGVLLLTYNLGSDGLNLQCASTVLICDFWWNSGKTKQSVARVNRFGQLAKEINIYYFTSNTGIEKGLFEKHHSKMKIEGEILYGHQETNIKVFSTEQILKLIETDEYIDNFKTTI
jgi:SNF2 family DNA or RNA helicase